MGSDKLTNEQVGAISKAHYNLKAALRFEVVQKKEYDDVSYAIKELEEVFEWLNVYQAAHKEDE
jgi:hypothetical protein|tara:strand:- start:563 stop:754 length:192 start_codon:yes stop_codon:yes gene_type:complete